MTDRGMRTIAMEKLKALAEAPMRFPVPLACAVLWASITIAREHRFVLNDREMFDREMFWQIQVFLLLCLFLSLSIKLFAESRQWKLIRWLLLTAVILGLLALAMFIGPLPSNAYESPAFLFMGPGVILLMIVAPFLRRGVENYPIWDFNFKSWTSAAFGLLVALVLAFGIVAALAAAEELFGLNIRGQLYEDVWIICLSVIWPWQTLAGVPGGFGAARTEYCPRWITYLIGWMLVPLALLYLALLYAFAVKITVQWSLPQGQIGWLVGGFAGFGLAVWHAAHPLRETGNRLVRSYVRFLHPALLVPVVLLAVGVGARVTEYGVTENRYGLILLTLWLAGIAVHGVIVRAPRLNIAPASFAALLILASFGPWGASAVSLSSQLARLDALLAEAGVLRDGKLSKPAEPVGSELAKQISGVVDYLNEPGKERALVAHIGDQGIEIFFDSGSEDMMAALGMEYINRWGNPRSHSWWRSGPDVMVTSGFDTAIRMSFGPGSGQSQPVEIGDAETRVHATVTGHALEISTTERGPVSVDLTSLVEALNRDGNPGYGGGRNAPLMTVEARGNGLKTRVYFTSIGIEGTIEAFEIDRLGFIVLIGLDEDG